MGPHEAKRAGTAGALLDIAPDPQVADVRLSNTPTEAHPSYGDCNGVEDGLRHLCVEQCGLAWDVAFARLASAAFGRVTSDTKVAHAFPSLYHNTVVSSIRSARKSEMRTHPAMYEAYALNG